MNNNNYVKCTDLYIAVRLKQEFSNPKLARDFSRYLIEFLEFVMSQSII